MSDIDESGGILIPLNFNKVNMGYLKTEGNSIDDEIFHNH